MIQRPERPITGILGGGRPPDPNRTRQDLTLTLTTLGGYDDNPTPDDSAGLNAFVPREPGYTGFADAGLRYWRGRQNRSLEIRTRGYLNSFRNLQLTPSYGGELQARLSTPLGRHVALELSENARSEPFYALGAFAPLRGDVPSGVLPDANPVNGFSIRRSWASDSSVSLIRRWSTRNTLTGTYSYSKRDFRDDIGDVYGHRTSLAYAGAIGRRSGVRLNYHHTKSEFLEQADTIRPIEEHSADLGYEHEHQVSQTRRWLVAFGAGVTNVDTISGRSREPLDYLTPSGYGNTRFDLGRTWSVRADYRRGVSVLEGLTAESFITDAAMLGVGGFVGSRSEIVFSAAYSEGATAAAGSTGEVQSYTGSAQLRFMITRWWSVVVSHSVYAYQLRGIENLPLGFPERLDRNAVRVGMTLDLPLYGAYTGRRAQPAEGN